MNNIKLTELQAKIAIELKSELRGKEIAHKLEISYPKFNKKVAQIYEKFSVNSRGQLLWKLEQENINPMDLINSK